MRVRRGQDKGQNWNRHPKFPKIARKSETKARKRPLSVKEKFFIEQMAAAAPIYFARFSVYIAGREKLFQK